MWVEHGDCPLVNVYSALLKLAQSNPVEIVDLHIENDGFFHINHHFPMVFPSFSMVM